MFSSPRYSLPARLMHWIVALGVLALYPLGLWATSRAEANLWDDLTNTLYAWHKTIGFAVLILMVLRLVIRVRGVAPPYPRNLAAWEMLNKSSKKAEEVSPKFPTIEDIVEKSIEINKFISDTSTTEFAKMAKRLTGTTVIF